MPKSRIVNELTILPMEKISGNVGGLLKHSKKAWNPVVKAQLAKKLAVAKNHKNVALGNPVKIEAHFQNGSVAVFLFIHEFYSLFEVHEVIRTQLSETISESRNISFNLMFLENNKPWRQDDLVDAMSSLVILNQWEPPNYSAIKNLKKPVPKYGFYTTVPSEKVSDIIIEAELKSRATNKVRTLAMTPANKLGSKELVDEALEVAKRLKIEAKFYDYNKLKEIGAGAFCAVLQTIESEGGIVVLKRPGRTRDIALVGKGVVFDTGGLDIKTESSMFGMHRDMTGAAVALSSFEALCKLKPKLSLTCYLAVGENLIGPKSYKPGDVIKTLSGKTMEIENTDAEGRLLLVDTLTMVNKDLAKKDSVIIDFATLTGAAVDVASTKRSVVTTNKLELWQNIVRSGMRSGERVVPMPIDDEYTDAVTSSKIADLTQCTGFTAEHCYAGALLSYFIDKEKTHIHMDLAAEHREGGVGLVGSDVTGFGVRWVFDFILRVLRI